MSVLIQGFTVVVKRDCIETDGLGAFQHFYADFGVSPEFFCDADPFLVTIGFRSLRDAGDTIGMLKQVGCTESRVGDAGEFVVVNQYDGPLTPCAWLQWERFTDDVSVAWMSGTEPGPLIAPEGWSPRDPLDVPAIHARHAVERFLPLVVEDDSHVVLDLETGAQIAAPVEAAAQGTASDPSPRASAATLHDAVLAAVASSGWNAYRADPPAAYVDLRGEHAVYVCRYFAPDSGRIIVCGTRSPVIVPETARARVMEYITRANYGLMLGGFEMDLDDGRLFFRATCAIEDGVPTTGMICTLANSGVWAFDQYLPEMLKVIHTRRRVVEAIEAAER